MVATLKGAGSRPDTTKNPAGTLPSGCKNLELVLHHLSEAVIAHDVDRRITFFNRSAEELSGISRAQALGRDCFEVFPGGFCGEHCSFCKTPESAIQAKTYTTTLEHADGRNRRAKVTVVPMRDADGALVGALAAANDLTEIDELRRFILRGRSFRGLVGRHRQMRDVYEAIRQVARVDAPVLISGETGTGKELVAAAIHAESRRRDKPLVPVNCGALPAGLLESELFGHVRGAFTGAVRTKKGRFEIADGGTIFLDEVGELSPAMQVKLLRVLQDQRIEPVGAEGSKKVDVRIISATNRDLRKLVEQRLFREDLYFRLCVVPMKLPPLRERGADILLLAEQFLEQFANEEGRPVPSLSPEAEWCLLNWRWPGNVRELRNAIQYALVKSGGEVIRATHLPADIGSKTTTDQGSRGRPGRKRKLAPADVRRALDEAGGNKAKAARLLGVGRSTIYRYCDDGAALTDDASL